MAELTFRLAERGSSFATRETAGRIGAELSAAVKPDHSTVVLDFQGVRVVSYSFADEIMKQVALVLLSSRAREASFSNCGGEIIDVFEATLEKRDRLGEYNLTASPKEHSLAISGAG